MRRIFFSIFLMAAVGLLPLSAQRVSAAVLEQGRASMSDLFKTMPQELFPQLTENNRLDMVDFLDSKMEAIVDNSLGGKSQLLALSTDSLSLQVSEALRCDARLLDVQSADSCSQVICMIATYGTDFQESDVRFYNTSWTPLPARQFILLPSRTYRAGFCGQTLFLTLSAALDAPAVADQPKLPEQCIGYDWNYKQFVETKTNKNHE